MSFNERSFFRVWLKLSKVVSVIFRQLLISKRSKIELRGKGKVQNLQGGVSVKSFTDFLEAIVCYFLTAVFSVKNLFIKKVFYFVKFRLMLSKEVCWANPSLREYKPASVNFWQLKKWNEVYEIVYDEKLRSIPFNGRSVWRSWVIFSNVRSVKFQQLLENERWKIILVTRRNQGWSFWGK